MALPGRGGVRDSSDGEDASLSQPRGPDKGQRSKLPGGPGLGLTSLLSSRDPGGAPVPPVGPQIPRPQPLPRVWAVPPSPALRALLGWRPDPDDSDVRVSAPI